MKVSTKLKIFLKSLLSLQYGEVATDKGNLKWNGEEDLKAGDEVFVENEEGEIEAAPDGEYITEDGKTIVVAEGKVAEIKDAEAEVAPESEGDQVESGIEAEEEPAPAEEPADEEEVSDEATIEERVARMESNMESILKGLENIVNAIAELEGRINDVEAKLASVEAPAAEPVEDETIEQSEQKRSILSYLRK